MADAEKKLLISAELKDKASKELEKLGGAGAKAGQSIAWGFLKAQLALGALKAGVKLVSGFLKDISVGAGETGDQVEKLSRRLGIGTETLSAWGYAAKLSGTSLEAVARSLKLLSKGAFDASRDMGEAKVAFADLGIVTKKADGTLRSAEDLFLDVADKLSKLDDASRKAALAQKLFGESGLEMLPMLEQGRDGLTKMIAEARRMGIVWTEEEAKRAAAFVDAETKFKASVEGIKKAIAVELFPKITPLLDKLAELIASNKDKIGEFASSMFDKLIPSVQEFARVAQDAAVQFRELLYLFGVGDKVASGGLGGPATGGYAMPGMSKDELLRRLGQQGGAAGLGGFDPDSVINVAPGDVIPAGGTATVGEAAEAAESMRSAFQGAGQAITSELEPALTQGLEPALTDTDRRTVDLSQSIGELTNPERIHTFAEDFAAGMQSAAEGLTKINMAAEAGAGIVRTLADGMGDYFNSIIDGTANAKEAFREMALDMLKMMQRLAMEKMVGSAFAGLPGLIGGIFGGGEMAAAGSTTAVAPTVAAANGGIVTRPTVALIGEAGPEAVVPLRAAKGFGGAASITINQTVVAPPGYDAQQIADLSADAILRKVAYSPAFRRRLADGLGGGL